MASLRRALRLGARSLATASVATLAIAVTEAQAAIPNTFGQEMFGIATGGAIQNEDAETLDRDLDAMAEAGSRWVRIDINWAQIQNSGPSSYNWTQIDRVVQGVMARGMKVLGVIVYTPRWARPAGADHTYGPDPAKYAQFASKAVEHYAAMGVHHYEVWNEPNLQTFWTPKPDPAAYTRLLKAAHPAIKGADPQATVLTAGTAPAPTNDTTYSPVDFLSAVYADGGVDSFDAVSHHPYCWPAKPGDRGSWSAWHQMYGTSPSLRSVMLANGDGEKKIWATEFGAPTNGPSESYPVSEATQADMITTAYSKWKTYEWAGPLFVYQHRDHGSNSSTEQDFFGLLRQDFSRKPAYAAYQRAVANWDHLSDPSGATGGTGGAGGTDGSSGAIGTDTTGADDPGETGSGDAGDPQGADTTAESRTTVKVTPTERGGKVEGNVRTSGVSTKSTPARGGQLTLTLHRKFEDGWKQARRARTIRLVVRGSFERSLRAFQRRRLRPGSYRVQASYTGSRDAGPSASRSRVFKLPA
jgi:polysaccharide biosynthesis protein PslG